MNELVRIALMLWSMLGSFQAPAIQVNDESLDKAYQSLALTTLTDVCVITLGTPWVGLSDGSKQGVMTHEVGHCLGLEHITCPSVMGCPTLIYRPNELDAAEFRRVHPMKHILHVSY